VNAEITYYGVFEQSMRNWWKHDSQRDTGLKKIFGSIFGDTGQYDLTTEVRYSEDLDQPIKVLGEFNFEPLKDAELPINLGASVMQLVRVFGTFSNLQIPETRKNRFATSIAATTKLTATFETPSLYSAALISSADDYRKPYMDLKQKILKRDGIYKLEITLHQPVLDLSLDDYRDFYNDTVSLSDHGTWLVSFHKNPSKVAEANIRMLEGEKGKGTLEYQIAVAKKYIDSGEFEKALPPAKRAVELDLNNGEAWFVLGMAQGFSGFVDESQKAFDQAKTLGYVP